MDPQSKSNNRKCCVCVNKTSEAFVFDLVMLKKKKKKKKLLQGTAVSSRGKAENMAFLESNKMQKASRDSAAENYKARDI